jgi:F-type H+-transporting ATPase subunit a
MDLTELTPDEVVLWDWGWGAINATIVYTWLVVALLGVGSWLITRRLSTGPEISRWQNGLEVVIDYMRGQITEISDQPPGRYLGFVGTLFLFIAVSNTLLIVPGFIAPTASLSTTAALALCVLVAVPAYGIAAAGVRAYLRQYLQPTAFMLPFNVIGELSRTLALAVRLFGNVLSSTKIVAILLAVAPLLFPAVLSVLGLVTGPGLHLRHPRHGLHRLRDACPRRRWPAGRRGRRDTRRTPREGALMDAQQAVAVASIVTAGLTMAIGSIGPAFGEARAVAEALRSLAQQPDEANTITRTLFVSLALIESTAIYCLVVALILIFANPFWNEFL